LESAHKFYAKRLGKRSMSSKRPRDQMSALDKLVYKDTNEQKQLGIEDFEEFRDMHIRNLNTQTAFLDNHYINKLKKGSAITREKMKQVRSMARPDVATRIR
jgi:hypothetical protein